MVLLSEKGAHGVSARREKVCMLCQVSKAGMARIIACIAAIAHLQAQLHCPGLVVPREHLQWQSLRA